MIDDDAYVKLAKCCIKACHVLKIATKKRSTGSLSGPRKEKIEDLGRCVDLAKQSLLTITSGIRTVRHIESAIRERVRYAHDLRRHHPGPTKECLVAWQEILEFFDVCGRQPTISTVSNHLRGTRNRTMHSCPAKVSNAWRGPQIRNLQNPFPVDMISRHWENHPSSSCCA
jgi:hypothetical protein